MSGAGATFPAPIYEQWFKQFPETIEGAGVDVRYDAVGSGKGIAAFTERRVDFGATDVPLNPEELAKAEAAGGAVIHVPTVLGRDHGHLQPARVAAAAHGRRADRRPVPG